MVAHRTPVAHAFSSRPTFRQIIDMKHRIAGAGSALILFAGTARADGLGDAALLGRGGPSD